MRHSIWIAILRPYEGDIIVIGIVSLREMVDTARMMELKMRYNPDMRLLTMRLPRGTRREQVMEAFDQLTTDERMKLYNLPRHSMVEHAA